MNYRIMKIYEAQQCYLLLAQAQVDGLSTDEVYNVIKATRSLKGVATNFDDFVKDTKEKVTDKKQQEEIVQKEYVKDVEVEVEKLGKEIFDKLIKANKWSVGQIMMLEDNVK